MRLGPVRPARAAHVASIEPTWSGNASPTTADYNARGMWKLYLQNLTSDPGYDSRYTLAGYMAYIRAGYAPRNTALKNAGHDGVTTGAVEGNWPVSRLGLLGVG